jgi:hypothetical protein
MRRWIKRTAWAAIVLFLGFMAIGIANLPHRPPMPRIAEAPPPKPLTTGTDAKVIRYTIGCPSQADYEALADIAVTMGAEAYNQNAQQYLVTGRCRAFNAGQDVQIAGVAVIAELRAIRPKGEAGTYWTTEKALYAERD